MIVTSEKDHTWISCFNCTLFIHFTINLDYVMLLITMEPTITNPRQLLEVVAKKHGVSITSLVGKTRQRDIVDIRSALVKSLRNDWNMSFPAIGRLFNRDHSTIMHLYQRKPMDTVEYLIPKDPLGRIELKSPQVL